jgi:hypothetical protein
MAEFSDSPVRLLRPVGQPLGSYLRPGRNDHWVLIQMLEANAGSYSGFVFDPCLEDRHRSLKEATAKHNLEAILDPRSIDLATEGGIARTGVASLPWGLDASTPHRPTQLKDAGKLVAEQIAKHAVDNCYTAVLAPTHYVAVSHEEWCAIDGELTKELRQALDALGGQEVLIYYPLAVSGAAFRSWNERHRLKTHLTGLPIDAVWLRIHPFGATDAGPQALRGYIEACWDLHALDVPLVAERVGTVGLALMAFGAVGGIESGVTVGERFNFHSVRRKPKEGDKGFLLPPRVYLAELGVFLKSKQASEFFEIRGMKSKFGCRDTDCCRRGVEDMIRDPRSHFLRKRSGEVVDIGRRPDELRAASYLDEFLRPATDLALTASRAYPLLEKTRVRLERWRTTLAALQREHPSESFAMTPRGQRVVRKSA